MSEENTVRYTRSDLGEGETDWERVDTLTDAEVEANATADPDNQTWTEEDFRNARLTMPAAGAKKAISIRLDPEVLSYFREMGPGYQTRINGVLRAYVRGRNENGE